MSLEMLKQKLLAMVDTTEDEELLQKALDVLSGNSFFENNADYKKRLKESIKQANTEKVLSSENVHLEVRKRILACTMSSKEAWQNEDDERWNAYLKD